MLMGLGKRIVKVNSRGCITPGPAPYATVPPSITSRPWTVRPPYIWTTAVETKVIRVGTRKGPVKGSGRAMGIPPGTREVNGVDKGKGVFGIWVHQPPNSPPAGLRARRPIPCWNLGVLPRDPLFEPNQQTPLLRWVSLTSVCHLWYMGASTIKSIFLV